MILRSRQLVIPAACALVLSACGGGGGTTAAPSPVVLPPQSATLQITTASKLPDTLRPQTYTTTLQSQGGQGALHWSIDRINPTTSFPVGLTIDASSGVLSGPVNWSGTVAFIATVTDSGSPAQTANKSFTVAAYDHSAATATQIFTVAEYFSIFQNIATLGGVPPFSFSAANCLPSGLRIDSARGVILGSAVAAGSFDCTVTVKDSYSPAEIISQPITFKVIAPQLSLAGSLPSQIGLNRLFDGVVVATGGTPPYIYSLTTGSIPGISSFNTSTGHYSGTPTANGAYALSFKVTDSSAPQQTASRDFVISVAAPIGRNDTPATATSIGNGSFIASISPYIDLPNGPLFAADHDYYKLSSVTGAIVRVDITRNQTGNPLDSVVEFLDSNGSRLSTCGTDPASSFNSPCINDDLDDTTQDSRLYLRVPGAASTAAGFLIHVFDWSGNARPDMRYIMYVSGVVDPFKFSSSSIAPTARGRNYGQSVTTLNGSGTKTFSLDSGQLPPGFSIDPSGFITGIATTLGDYTFVVKATDSSSPPQVITQQFTIKVVDPLKIVSAATLPPACNLKPYSFTPQTTAGAPPIMWGFFSNNWPAVNLDNFTGTLSGTPNVLGTFTGNISATDATHSGDGQVISLTVMTCP
jgi:hypothetical protein